MAICDARYFAAMGIPIVRGRDFIEQERSSQEMPIVLSQELARRLFPNGDVLGQHVLSTSAGVWHTVVGVAGDVVNNGLERRPEPEYYEPAETFRGCNVQQPGAVPLAGARPV